jgi:hypothetical protein
MQSTNPSLVPAASFAHLPIDSRSVRLCGYMWRSGAEEVLGGNGEPHDVHKFIHQPSSIELTRALPPIPQDPSSGGRSASLPSRNQISPSQPAN